MEVKSIVLLALVILLVFYVGFVYIQEKIWIGKTKCESDSCVRFCLNSSQTINLEANENFKNLNKNYTSITNKYCNDVSNTSLETWSFLEDGKVEGVDGDENVTMEWFEYCLLYVNENEFALKDCMYDTAVNKMTKSYPYFMLASVPFLIITIIIYAWIPELHNLPGKCLMCYIISVLFLYIFYAMAQIYKNEIANILFYCELSGYIQFLSFMMCFLWLNVLCYDVWSTISRLYSSGENMMLFKYSLYGFGIPVLITILVYILHAFNVIPYEYQHNLGKNNVCFIGGDKEPGNNNPLIIYYIIPLSIMLTINVIFYAITTFTIFRIQQKTANMKSNSRYTQNKRRFFLYFRLFIIMGITWISEAITSFTGSNMITATISIINCLQGVLIFMHFVVRTRVKKLIVKSLNLKRESRTETETAVTTPTTDLPKRKMSTEIPLKKISSEA